METIDEAEAQGGGADHCSRSNPSFRGVSIPDHHHHHLPLSLALLPFCRGEKRETQRGPFSIPGDFSLFRLISTIHSIWNSQEEVRVALDQLPRDATDILDILKAEQAPLHLWLIIAREYFKQGKVEQFQQILEEGSSPEIDEYYADVKFERIAILNALGAYYTYLGKIDTNLGKIDPNQNLIQISPILDYTHLLETSHCC